MVVLVEQKTGKVVVERADVFLVMLDVALQSVVGGVAQKSNKVLEVVKTFECCWSVEQHFVVFVCHTCNIVVVVVVVVVVLHAMLHEFADVSEVLSQEEAVVETDN